MFYCCCIFLFGCRYYLCEMCLHSICNVFPDNNHKITAFCVSPSATHFILITLIFVCICDSNDNEIGEKKIEQIILIIFIGWQNKTDLFLLISFLLFLFMYIKEMFFFLFLKNCFIFRFSVAFSPYTLIVRSLLMMIHNLK